MPTHSPSDPANASSANTDTSGAKPQTALEALSDPSFLPTLDEAPIEQKAKSHLLLVLLVLGAVVSAWFMGFSVLQVPEQRSWSELAVYLAGASAVALALVFWTGTASIDLWSLVMKWGWYTIPVACAAGLIFVMMQERTEELQDLD